MLYIPGLNKVAKLTALFFLLEKSDDYNGSYRKFTDCKLKIIFIL